MSDLPAIIGNVPTVFSNRPDDTADLGAGIQASFGILTYRGKIWRTKYKGEERAIMRQDEPGSPVSFLDLVIVKASPVISKIWYKNGYTQGDTNPPDCFSVNGLVPDPASPERQAPHCATCPQNVWGSRATERGSKGKACADNKRMAVVPELDIRNAAFGGPMMLRCPPASLQGLSTYSGDLQRAGGRYYGAVTRISFDVTAEYPHLVFTAKRWLSNDEALTVIEQQDGDVVARILSEAIEAVRAEGDAPPSTGPAVPPSVGIAGTPPNVGVSKTEAMAEAFARDNRAQQQAAQPTVVAGGTVATGSDPYQYTPDGKYRWRAGMTDWEPNPPPAAAAPPPPVIHAPDQSGTIVPPNPLAGQVQQQQPLDLTIPEHLRRPLPTAQAGSAFAPAPPPAAVVAPPVTVQPAAPTTFAPAPAPTPAPVSAPVTPGGQETPDQMRARIEAEVRQQLANEAAGGAARGRGRPRVRNPSPTNGASAPAPDPTAGGASAFGQPAGLQLAQPAQVTPPPPPATAPSPPPGPTTAGPVLGSAPPPPPPISHADAPQPPPAPGPGTDALAALNAKLNSLLPSA